MNGRVVSMNRAGSKASRNNNQISYVEQDPKFFSNMTVRETLMLDCRLRDQRATKSECEKIVEDVLSKYGLTSCADTLVGGDTGGKDVRGISGGEKRRLSIACETAFSSFSNNNNTNNNNKIGEEKEFQLVVCDEPTSGLDAFSADRVVSQLAGLAVETKCVVVASLHQPRSASWLRAHDVMLLANGGRVAYHGPVSKCVEYFSSIGYECPTNYNPAEFLIDLVSIVSDCGVKAMENSIERVDDICNTWRRQKPFIDRQSLQIEYEESAALYNNQFNSNRNRKQRTMMLMNDFDNMMNDSSLSRSETTITMENGAPLSFRDFEKTFAAPRPLSPGFHTNIPISKDREIIDETDDLVEGYKLAQQKQHLVEKENEFQAVRKKILSPKNDATKDDDDKTNDNDAVNIVNTTTTTKNQEIEEYDANDGRNHASFGSSPPSPFKQFQLLVGRSWKQTRREMWVNGVRLVASVGLATAFGSCNFRLSKHPSTIKRRVSVLMQSCINTGMLALCRTLNNFPRERLVVSREMRRNCGGYHPGAYFFAKLLVETPIDMLFPVAFGMIVSPMVGLNPAGRNKFISALALHAASSAALGLAVSAIAPTAETALAIGPCIMVLSIMLGDSTGAFGEVPLLLKPLSNLSVVKWSFEGVLASEFEQLVFNKDDKESESSKQLRLRTEQKKRELHATKHGFVYDATKWATEKLESIGPERGEDVLQEFGLKTKGQSIDAAKGQIGVFLLNIGVAFVALTLKEK